MKQRLFLAIPLPIVLKESIHDALESFMMKLSDDQRKGIRFITPKNWHITVYFFGDVLREQVTLLENKIQKLIHSTPSFDLIPDQLLLAPPEKRNKNMIWMRFQDNPILTRLSFEIYEATKQDFKFEKPRPTLIPHITVARFKDLRFENLPPLTQPIISSNLYVNTCELWDSILGPGGAEYSSIQGYQMVEGIRS